MADTQPESAPVEEKKEEESLPPLSDHDFKIFNRMSEHMDLFVTLPLSLPRPLSRDIIT